MPKVTVYVRKDDYSKWQSIQEKTEFIHKALNPVVSITPDGKSKMLDTSYEKPIVKGTIKTKEQAKETIKKIFPDAKYIEPVTYKKTQNWGA